MASTSASGGAACPASREGVGHRGEDDVLAVDQRAVHVEDHEPRVGHARSSNGSALASCGRQPNRSQVRAMCSGSGAVRFSRAPVIGWVRLSERACRCSLRLTWPPSCAPQPSSVFSWALPPYLPSPTIGMADGVHVRAQLVGAAGDRGERDPGGAFGRRLDDRVVGGGALGALGARDGLGGDDMHLLALAAGAVPGGLDETVADGARARMRHAGDHRPVDLARVARLKGLGQTGGGADAARQHENARGVAVEAVNQPRLVVAVELQRLGEPVDMAGRPGPALRGEARRLVDREDVVVAIEDRGADHRGVGLRHGGARRGLGLRVVRDRRQAHALAGGEAGRGLGAGAVDADLALAAHALDAALPEMRMQPPQPAVEPLVGVVRRDGDLGYAAHGPVQFRTEAKPAARASRPSMTEPPT